MSKFVKLSTVAIAGILMEMLGFGGIYIKSMILLGVGLLVGIMGILLYLCFRKH